MTTQAYVRLHGIKVRAWQRCVQNQERLSTTLSTIYTPFPPVLAGDINEDEADDGMSRVSIFWSIASMSTSYVSMLPYVGTYVACATDD